MTTAARIDLPAEETEKALAFLKKLSCPTGGFRGKLSEPNPTLQNTLSAIKAFKTLGAELPNSKKHLAFIETCRHPDSGAFSNEPGGEPAVFAAAAGYLAWHELEPGIPENFLQQGLAYMTRNAFSFPENFMVIAFYEECLIPPPAPPSVVAFFRHQREPDGTFGASAFNNAAALTSLLRAGLTVDHPEPVITKLLNAQQNSGGFSDQNHTIDLMTTYTVMRALLLLGISPDLEKLGQYLQTLKHPDGGYAGVPNGEATAGATYQVLSLMQWLKTFPQTN